MIKTAYKIGLPLIGAVMGNRAVHLGSKWDVSEFWQSSSLIKNLKHLKDFHEPKKDLSIIAASTALTLALRFTGLPSVRLSFVTSAAIQGFLKAITDDRPNNT
jgi:hypothetical protein